MSVALHHDSAAGRVTEELLGYARVGLGVDEQARSAVSHVVKAHAQRDSNDGRSEYIELDRVTLFP